MYYESCSNPIDDLIAIIRDFIDRNCFDDPVLGAAISLLGRFTILENNVKTTEKSWRFFEVLLSNISLKEALQCRLDSTTIEWMLNSSTVLKPRLVQGRSFLPRQGRIESNKQLRKNHFALWDHGYILKCYSFYFGNKLPEKLTSLDLLVLVFRILGMFSKLSESSQILEFIYKFLPTFLMPSCELASSGKSSTIMENWLLLVNYSVTIGLSLTNYMQLNEKRNRTEYEKCLELTITHTLSHARKLLSVDEMLEQILAERSSFPLFAELRFKITNLAFKFLSDSITLLPFSVQFYDPLFESLNSAIEYFLSRAQSKPAFDLALHILNTKCHTRFLSLFCLIVNSFKNDRTMWNTLLELLTAVPHDFCLDMSSSVLLKTFLFPVNTREQIQQLESIVERHFKNRPLSFYDTEEFTQTWIYFEHWFFSKSDPIISLSALKIFSYIAPVLSDEDFRRCSKVLLSCGLFEGEILQTNMLNMTMEVFSRHLRSGGPTFDDLLDGIITNSFNNLLSTPIIQDSLFELVKKMLVIADNSQFLALVDLLFDRFKIVLQMALTDIWVLLCDSAENSFNALRHFLFVFKFCLSHPKLLEIFAKQFIGKCDISVLLQTCLDVFQNASKISTELSKGSQIIALVLFILFSTQKSPQDYITRSINSIIENADSSVNFSLLYSLIYECVYTKIDQIKQYQTIEEISDDECSKSNSQLIKCSTFCILQEGMFTFGLRIFDQILANSVKSNSNIGYELSNVCALLEGRQFYEEHLEKLTSTLFEATKRLAEKPSYLSELTRLINTIGSFLVQNPTPSNITQLLSFSYTSSECFETIMRWLEHLLQSRELKPNYTLKFPQYLITQQENLRQLSSFGDRFEETGAYFVLDPTYKIFADEGMTVSFWINLTQQKTNSFIHVLSLGTSKLAVSLHLNPRRNKLKIGISFKDQVLATRVFNNAFGGSKKWVNVMLGTVCRNGRVETLVVFGGKSKLIECNVELGTGMDTFFVSLGCVVSPVFELTPSYEISTIFGFKGLLTNYCALLLRSMGCARDSLTNCALNQIDVSFLKCLTKPIFRSRSGLLFTKTKLYVEKLQRKLLFTINASNPQSYALSILQNSPDMEKQQSMTMLLTISQEIRMNWRCQFDSQSPNSLDRALLTIGHLKLFIFAYALSVDREYSAEAQCSALSLLVCALKRDPTAHRVFIEMDGVVLIVRILGAKSAHFTSEIFNVLANLIFSKLEYRNGTVYSSPFTCIAEPSLLNALVSSSSLWQGENFKIFAHLLQLVNDCLCESYVLENIQKFNHSQLVTDFFDNLLNSLLLMVRVPENYPTCNLPTNSTKNEKPTISFTSILNDLVEKLLEPKIQIQQDDGKWNVGNVAKFWNFIQLSHPPSDTHVDKAIRGRNSWIRTDLSPPDRKSTIEDESELAIFLTDLCKKHPKEKIQECMTSTGSIISVRKKFIGSQKFHTVPSDPNRLLSVFETKPIEKFEPTMPINDSQKQQSFQTSNWTVELRYLFLEQMSEIVLNCNDSAMACIELDIVYWQAILTLLSNQRHPKTRSATFKLLKQFFLRCDQKYKDSFALHQGFVLLSNELRKFPIDIDTVDALFSLTCGEAVTIFHGLDSRHLQEIKYDKFKIFSLYTLFTLLEESMDDSTMFWSVCSTLQKMFISEQAPRLAFFEMGLVNAMINVLKKLCLKCESPDLNGPVFPLLDCWISFSCSIINMTVTDRDKMSYAYCQDFVWLCIIADWQSSKLQNSQLPIEEFLSNNLNFDSSTSTDSGVLIPKPPATTPSALRRMLCHLLFAWTSSIQSVLSDPFHVTVEPSELNSDDFEDELDYDILGPGTEYSFQSVNRMELREKANKKSKLGRILAPVDELTQRLLFGLQMINDSFIFLTPSERVSDEEEALFNLQLELLISTWQKRMNQKLNEWQTVLGLCKERSLSLLADLIACLLFPVQQKRVKWVIGDQKWMLIRRLKLARALATELPTNRIQLVSLLEINLDYQHAMKIAIHELVLCSRSPSVGEYDEDLDKLSKFLRSIQIKSPLSSLTDSEIQSLSTDEDLLLHMFYDKESEFVTILANKARSLRTKEQEFLESVSNKADEVNCQLAELQSPLRRERIFWRKQWESKEAKTTETLCDLVNQLCHPEAIVFYNKNSWPKGSALDTTENIKRERRRLKAANYNFPLKFLQKDRREEIGEPSDSPLDKLLEGSLSRSAIERVEANSQIRRSMSVILIRTVFECSGEIVLSDKKFYFLGESSKSTQKGKHYSPVSYSWTFEQIREIQNRFYLLKDTAMELFTTTGEAFLIVFSSGQNRQMLLDHLISLNLGNLIVDTKEQLFTSTKMWRSGQITNFDYLMFLNKLAGRTFNDLMQYPVFPFILSNYSSSSLDLNSSHSYRDLSRPMPIQDKKMESFYVQNYNTLLEECNKNTDTGFLHMAAYHYGSHYSNTGIVAHFMVRISPYTNVALEYQDGNFDIADRLFSKLETTWRLSSSESTTDFKELTPEFFFFPEMFKNVDRLELGIRQNGHAVNDVELPSWCPANNPRLFCLIHRQALESVAVTNNLHNWIDLIFGYKQQGDAAVRATNIFHPSTYRGRDLEQKSGGDSLYLNAILTMQKTYGQMPDQLFQSPHLPHMSPGRINSNSVENQLIQSVRGLKWGDFVGSPETNDRLNSAPACVFQLEDSERIDHLIPLNYDGSITCYGMPHATAMICKYKTDRDDILRRSFELSITAALSWSFPDRILRIKQMQNDDSLWVNLMELSSFEVSKIAFSPSNDHLYIGFTNGLIRVYLLTFKNEQKQWNISQKSELFGHRSTITSLQISDNFHVALSTCADHACLWDTNSLGFVRKFTSIKQSNVEETLKLSLISSISCDIALVFDTKFGSRASLYTVNGDLIGSYSDNMRITSLAMTNLDEGTGINCLALGLETGAIRLLEVWTMTTIRFIICPRFTDPVVSLLFVNNCSLYAAYASKTTAQNFVLCWTSSMSSKRTQQTNFKMLNPFM